MKKILFTLLICLSNSYIFSQSQQTAYRGVYLDDSNYVAPQKEIDWALKFKGISGPGQNVKGDGRGGWRSGVNGVAYQGLFPLPEYSIEKVCSGTAVDLGLTPPILPALDVHLRDGVVTLGGDGYYYLTGSSGDNIWAWSKGIELWRSFDLHKWTYLGLIWDIDKEAPQWVKRWRKHPRRAVRAVWAPEIHYIKGNYYICYSMCPGGIGLLKSISGQAIGPYVNAFNSDNPIVDGIDATLFEDTNGNVYFSYGGGTVIAQLKDDLSSFASPFRRVIFTDYDLNLDHHSKSCRKRQLKDIGHEGVTIFKHNGKYYLGAADDYEGRYSTCLAISDSIYGPYKMRHESVPCGGGTGFFKDKEGDWWCSYFGNDSQSHFREKIGFVKIQFTDQGRVIPAKDQPFVPKQVQKEWRKKWDKIWKVYVAEP